MRTRSVVLGGLAAAGVAIAAAWGFQALLVFVFFVALSAGLAYVAGVGGNWVRDVSSRRFEDRRR